jgi:DNA ligase (NAD+)
MGERSAANVIDSIEKSKRQPLWRLIAGVGIRHVGGQSAEILAEKFGSLEALMGADEETLQGLDQIGPVMAKSVFEYFRDEDNAAVVRELLAAGVRPEKPQQKQSDVLAGKSIVVTGTLESFTRQGIKKAIKDNGGKSSSSVSKKTSFVIAGANAGSKRDTAEKLGVEVIDEQRFMEMIGG